MQLFQDQAFAQIPGQTALQTDPPRCPQSSDKGRERRCPQCDRSLPWTGICGECGYGEPKPRQALDADRADIRGRRVIITVPTRNADIPGEEYPAIACGADHTGTLTFSRCDDGFIGVAGRGAWRLA